MFAAVLVYLVYIDVHNLEPFCWIVCHLLLNSGKFFKKEFCSFGTSEGEQGKFAFNFQDCSAGP